MVIRVKVLGICYQEMIYSGCLECVVCCVLADELLYLVFLNIHIMCVDGDLLSLLGAISSAWQFQSNPRKLTRGKLLMKYMYRILLT